MNDTNGRPAQGQSNQAAPGPQEEPQAPAQEASGAESVPTPEVSPTLLASDIDISDRPFNLTLGPAKSQVALHHPFFTQVDSTISQRSGTPSSHPIVFPQPQRPSKKRRRIKSDSPGSDPTVTQAYKKQSLILGFIRKTP